MDDMRRWRHTWTGIELAVQAMKAHDDQGVQEAAICLLCKLSLKVQLAARIKEVTGGVEAIERAVAGALAATNAGQEDVGLTEGEGRTKSQKRRIALNIMFWGRQLLARLAQHVSERVESKLGLS